ncbi:ChaC-like protein [Suillus americanus]|nr:ChaC-like protein [Suillus americanus]
MGSINAPFVVFGYGSLIFKPPPHVRFQTSGFLKGYVRRFAQESHDHRGTPENPGRVVTLIHKEDWDRFSRSDAFPDEDIVWGIAYTIDPEYEAEVRDYLDYREKDGYTMETLHVYTIENGIEKIAIQDVCNTLHLSKCYVGRPDNPSFIGSEPLEDLAQRIWASVGPSGPNKAYYFPQEYLYRLAESVRQLAPASYDSHLFALEVSSRTIT